MTFAEAHASCERDTGRPIKVIEEVELKHGVLVILYSSMIPVPDVGKVMYELRCSTFVEDRCRSTIIVKTVWRKK